ncbi:uncharacterized protein IWZ02DRAFT_447003 [Phyllosticta citriasiana]|uniref:uncharacterized protein n=1 Tax=Phyllosticta citriasiana TaxID=595635 RepID=UPI0030FD9654
MAAVLAVLYWPCGFRWLAGWLPPVLTRSASIDFRARQPEADCNQRQEWQQQEGVPPCLLVRNPGKAETGSGVWPEAILHSTRGGDCLLAKRPTQGDPDASLAVIACMREILHSQDGSCTTQSCLAVEFLGDEQAGVNRGTSGVLCPFVAPAQHTHLAVSCLRASKRLSAYLVALERRCQTNCGQTSTVMMVQLRCRTAGKAETVQTNDDSTGTRHVHGITTSPSPDLRFPFSVARLPSPRPCQTDESGWLAGWLAACPKSVAECWYVGPGLEPRRWFILAVAVASPVSVADEVGR